MADNSILEPLHEYESRLKQEYHENATKYFNTLLERSGCDEEVNTKTITELRSVTAEGNMYKKKASTQKGLRIFMIILIIASFIAMGVSIYQLIDGASKPTFDPRGTKWVTYYIIIVVGLLLAVGLIVLICLVVNKKIKKYVERYTHLDNERDRLNSEADEQTATLRRMFDWNMPNDIIKETCPLIELDKVFDMNKLIYMNQKYGYKDFNDEDETMYFVQSGSIVGNPFLYERTYYKRMYNHRYNGSLVIRWQTRHYDSQGNLVTENHTQTLYAHVTAPAPTYGFDTNLIYGNDAAPNLNFSRKPSGASSMSDKAIDKKVKRGEKQLKKQARKSLTDDNPATFTEMSNSEFDVLFGANDRDNEVEFRLLFTPLAQKNLTALIRSKTSSYGDDFAFTKIGCVNLIHSAHSQNNDIYADPYKYKSFSIVDLRKQFVDYNDQYFRDIFFDLAPLLSIPLYQQHKPLLTVDEFETSSNYTSMEHESLANSFSSEYFEHPSSKTNIILKEIGVQKAGTADIVTIRCHSFDTINHVEYISVRGGDGYYHDVPVPWIEYVPIFKDTNMVIQKIDITRPDYVNLINHCEPFYNFFVDRAGDLGGFIFQRGLLACVLRKGGYSAADAQNVEKMVKDFLSANPTDTMLKSMVGVQDKSTDSHIEQGDDSLASQIPEEVEEVVDEVKDEVADEVKEEN